MRTWTERDAADTLDVCLHDARTALAKGRMLEVGEHLAAARRVWTDMRERAIGSEADVDDPDYTPDFDLNWTQR